MLWWRRGGGGGGGRARRQGEAAAEVKHWRSDAPFGYSCCGCRSLFWSRGVWDRRMVEGAGDGWVTVVDKPCGRHPMRLSVALLPSSFQWVNTSQNHAHAGGSASHTNPWKHASFVGWVEYKSLLSYHTPGMCEHVHMAADISECFCLISTCVCVKHRLLTALILYSSHVWQKMRHETALSCWTEF